MASVLEDDTGLQPTADMFFELTFALGYVGAIATPTNHAMMVAPYLVAIVLTPENPARNEETELPEEPALPLLHPS